MLLVSCCIISEIDHKPYYIIDKKDDQKIRLRYEIACTHKSKCEQRIIQADGKNAVKENGKKRSINFHVFLQYKISVLYIL